MDKICYCTKCVLRRIDEHRANSMFFFPWTIEEINLDVIMRKVMAAKLLHG
jgi:hypothetical protein